MFIFLFVSIIAFAQSTEEGKLAAAASALNKAMIDPDKNMLESLTAEELSYGHSTGKIENKMQFITALTSGAVDFSSIDITDQTIKIAGDNAIVRGSLQRVLTPQEILTGHRTRH